MNMDLQNIFYILGILVMISWLIFVGTVIYFLWKIHQAIREFKKQTVERVENVLRQNKARIAGAVGAGVVTLIADRIRRLFR